MTSGFCDNLLEDGAVRVLTEEPIGAVMIVLAILYLIMSVLIIYWIKLQERFAQIGDDKAVQSVIFPIFVQALWLNAAVNVYVGIIALSFNFNPYANEDKGGIWAFAVMWALQHTVVEGVAVLLMQKGLGLNAAIRTMKVIAVWALLTLFVYWAVYNALVHDIGFALNVFWNMLLVVFYASLWLTPRKYLYRRPAAIVYAKFWTIFRTIALIAIIFFYIPETEIIANCVYTFGSLFPFAIGEPIVLYYTLLLDSRWWQGLDIAGTQNASSEEIKSPLRGMDLDLKSAQTLAESMDTLGVSASRSKPKAVKLLNFAYISLDKSKLLGSGSFSKVYLGKYRNRACAIKLIFTIDVTQEIISRIAAEAQILSTLKHPNVVEILGVSVLPPSVCILLELCAFGSLNDVIGGAGFAALGTVNDFVKHFLRGSAIIGKYSNRGLNISWKDRLQLATGCARGLAALHALKPEVCHRDVKSMNFLVDENLNAKISDLELGTTDDLLIPSEMKKNIPLKRRPLSNNSQSSSNNDSMRSELSGTTGNSNDSKNNSIRPLSLESSRSSKASRDDGSAISLELGVKIAILHGDDFLANWAAPEVIKDAYHSQASDIYSFGLVLWELLVGTVPFSDIKRQDDIREKVLNDVRPDIPQCFLNPPYDHHFITYTDLIQRCWSPEPLLRPNINFILERLELLYKEQCYSILSETSAVEKALDEANGSTETRKMTVRNFFKNKYSNITAEHLQLIEKYLQEEDSPTETDVNSEIRNVLEEFDQTEEAWCLCLPDQTFTIVWGSNRLEECLCTPKKELFGKSLKALPCFEAKEKQRTYFFRKPKNITTNQEKIENFFNKLRELKPNFEKHFVLELVVNRFRAFSNLGTSRMSSSDLTGVKVITATSLFSLHCYSITTRPLASSNIAITASSPLDYQYHEFAHSASLATSPMVGSSLRRISTNNKSYQLSASYDDPTSTLNPNTFLQWKEREEKEHDQIEDFSIRIEGSESAPKEDSTSLKEDSSSFGNSNASAQGNGTNVSRMSRTSFRTGPAKSVGLIAIVFTRLKDVQVDGSSQTQRGTLFSKLYPSNNNSNSTSNSKEAKV